MAAMLGSTVGDTSGEYWQGLSATNGRVTEAFLLGSSTFTNVRSESLGNIFNTSGAHDLVFTYTNIFGDIVSGVVQYFTPVGVPGDYNNNGIVDSADYVLWRNGGPLQNEVDNPGTVNAARLHGLASTIRQHVGQRQWPEWARRTGTRYRRARVLALALCRFLATVRRSALRDSVVGWAAVCTTGPREHGIPGERVLLGLSLIATASAALPPPPVLDRNYRMGDEREGEASLETRHG